MPNTFFQFKEFTVRQERTAMKVCTDACLFGAWVADGIRNADQVKRILDIGAGTGLLALMVAQKSNALIETIEIDRDASAQAKENVQLSPWKDRINVFHLALQNFTPAAPYQVIISNPPFFTEDLPSPDAKKNAAKHSTELDFSELLAFTTQWLDQKGKSYFLVPFHRLADITEEACRQGLYATEIVNVRQTASHGYFRSMICFRKSKGGLSEKEIVIKETQGTYSADFASLLADYYLYL